jgi:MoxR-like ATPase
MVIATQNPIEQEGTYRLPEAQLDRFMFKISVDFPKYEEELEILTQKLNNPLLTDISQIRPVVNFETVLSVRKMVEQVYVDPQLLTYITKIVMATRNNPSIYLGASTRASIALLHAARVMAIFENRDFVTPDDIRALAVPVLAHRIQLTVEREIDQVTTAQIIKEILSTVEVPR